MRAATQLAGLAATAVLLACADPLGPSLEPQFGAKDGGPAPEHVGSGDRNGDGFVCVMGPLRAGGRPQALIDNALPGGECPLGWSRIVP
jgi:hypothetical protein